MSRPVLIATIELIVIVAAVAVYLQLNDGAAPPAGLQTLRLERDGSQITVSTTVQTGDSGLFQLELDWGDGRAELLPVDGTRLQNVRSTHTYSADGAYEVQLRATFEDGSATVRRGTVVIPPATAATPSPAASPASTQPPVAGAEPEATPEAEPTETPESTETPEPTDTPEPTETAEPQPTSPAGNQPPEVFIVDLASLPALVVTLTAIATDAEGALIAVAIDWGDGQSQELAGPGGNISLSHSYAAPGTYTVTVVALDAGGRESVASASVTAAE